MVRGGDSILAYLIGIVLIVLILWLTLYGVFLYNRPTRLRLRAHQIARLANRVLRARRSRSTTSTAGSTTC